MAWDVPRPGSVLLAQSGAELARFEELQFDVDPPGREAGDIAERLPGARGWFRVFGEPLEALTEAIDGARALRLRAESRVMRLEVTVTVDGDPLPFVLHEMGLMMTQLPFRVGEDVLVELDG